MSEKRFSVRLRSECDGVVYSFFDGDKLLDVDMILDLLNEQQSTIRKLQDLCGESDGENAKLRIENKKLKEENEQLRQNNKELQSELDLVANFKVWSRRKLEEENEQLKRDEQLYAKEILRLKEQLKEKEIVKLGGDY